MIIAFLVILGLCLGSFVNAYVWRVRQQETVKKKQRSEYSVLKGRSMCPHCKHTLAAKDLIPVLSWLSLRGKCRYCNKPISAQYPVVELFTAVLLVISYIGWPAQLAGLEWVQFGLWGVVVVLLMALAVYDLKWMLLPNRMVLPLAIVVAVFVGIQVAQEQSLSPVFSSAWGAAIGGGLFYILFQISQGRWIGGGDVKLGAVLGIVTGGPMNGILLLFVASLSGTLVALPLMLTGKAKRGTQLPFGPFLIFAAYVVGLYGQRIVDWYNLTFLIV